MDDPALNEIALPAVGYVTYIADGSLDGSYFQVPTIEHFSRMIEVDESTRMNWVGHRANAARDGVEILPPAPVAPPVVLDYVGAIQDMLDTKVQEHRYLNILSACSYSSSTNPTFKAEADACIAWRDEVWAKAYVLLDQVQTGAALQPSIAGLLAMLPKLTWPD